MYHYLRVTGDVDFAAELWPVVDAALSFVLRWQLADGTIRWSLDAQGLSLIHISSYPVTVSAIAASTWFQGSLWPPVNHGI